MKKNLIRQIVKITMLFILMSSFIGFVIVFQLKYTSEALIARAIPLALVVGLSSIATSIMFQKE